MKFTFGDLEWWLQATQEKFELLKAYASIVEKQLEIGLGKFVNLYEKYDFEDLIPETHQRVGQTKKIYDGLEDTSWNIKAIHEDYFPKLHRRSCFITIYSFLELSLEDLCNRFGEERNFHTTFKKLKGRGID